MYNNNNHEMFLTLRHLFSLFLFRVYYVSLAKMYTLCFITIRLWCPCLAREPAPGQQMQERSGEVS